MANQPKLRPLIHSAASAFLITLQLEDYAYAISNLKHLQDMLFHVRNQASGTYGSTLPQALEFKLSRAEYVVRRIVELHTAGTLEGTQDLSVFGDSLTVRFESLIDELDSLDQEPI